MAQMVDGAVEGEHAQPHIDAMFSLQTTIVILCADFSVKLRMWMFYHLRTQHPN